MQNMQCKMQNRGDRVPTSSFCILHFLFCILHSPSPLGVFGVLAALLFSPPNKRKDPATMGRVFLYEGLWIA
jgi:hypothetical protein